MFFNVFIGKLMFLTSMDSIVHFHIYRMSRGLYLSNLTTDVHPVGSCWLAFCEFRA